MEKNERTMKKEMVDSRLVIRVYVWAALVLCISLLVSGSGTAQTARPTPTPTTTEQPIPHVGSAEVIVTAPRIDIAIKENPAATTVVSGEQLSNQPKTINAKEVLLLVPGQRRPDGQLAVEEYHGDQAPARARASRNAAASRRSASGTRSPHAAS